MKLDNIQIETEENSPEYILEDISQPSHIEKRYYGGFKADPEEPIKHVQSKDARRFGSKSKARSFAKNQGFWNKMMPVKI